MFASSGNHSSKDNDQAKLSYGEKNPRSLAFSDASIKCTDLRGEANALLMTLLEPGNEASYHDGIAI